MHTLNTDEREILVYTWKPTFITFTLKIYNPLHGIQDDESPGKTMNFKNCRKILMIKSVLWNYFHWAITKIRKHGHSDVQAGCFPPGEKKLTCCVYKKVVCQQTAEGRKKMK